MMSIRREITYKNYDGEWYMYINYDNTIVVGFFPEDGETGPAEREYIIPEDITGIEHNLEYVWLTLKDKRMIQLKFEEDGNFIGDIFDDKSNHLDTFACYSFWDDIEIL